MLALGHTGITLGVAAIIAQLAAAGRRPTEPEAPDRLASKQEGEAPLSRPGPARWPRTLALLADYVDIRLVLVGSLLPDIIDKPLGMVFLSSSLSNGRIFAHTLLFLALMTLTGLIVYRRTGRNWLLVLSFGTATHLVFDGMWSNLHTLLWPAYGLGFDKLALSDWLPRMARALKTNPAVYVPEAIGGVIMGWFVWVLVQSRSIFTFLRHGRQAPR